MNASYEIVLAFEKKTFECADVQWAEDGGCLSYKPFVFFLLFFLFLILKIFDPITPCVSRVHLDELTLWETLALSAISSASHLMSAPALSRI